MSKVYDIITEKVIQVLEKGDVPWLRPWAGGQPPTNLVSKKQYRGINVFLLACAGFSSPYWVSYKQAKQLGGNVKKGEKSTLVVIWKQLTDEDTDKETGEVKTKTIPLLR